MGKETASSSKDQILKQEMPLAFKRVEESSIFLVEASQILRRDPLSSEARKKLIDGARGTRYSFCELKLCNLNFSRYTPCPLLQSERLPANVLREVIFVCTTFLMNDKI